MKQFRNLEKSGRLISEKLLETIYLLDILKEFHECDPKIGTLLTIAGKNVNYAFNEVEKLRELYHGMQSCC